LSLHACGFSLRRRGGEPLSVLLGVVSLFISVMLKATIEKSIKDVRVVEKSYKGAVR
jgi:hypothetical protein